MCGGPLRAVLAEGGIDGPDSREVVIERSARLHLSPWSGSAGGPDSPAAARRVAEIPPPALPGRADGRAADSPLSPTPPPLPPPRAPGADAVLPVDVQAYKNRNQHLSIRGILE